MAVDPELRIVVNPNVDYRGLPLTPADFFLFSRVQELSSSTTHPTAGELIAASGQPSDHAEQSLLKLIELGLVVVNAAEAAPVRGSRVRTSTNTDDDLRKRAHDRKRDLLAAQIRAMRLESSGTRPVPNRSEPSEASSEDSLPTPRNDQQQATSVAVQSILDQIEPVDVTDPRIDPSLEAMSVDRQRRVLSLRDKLRQVGHFEILGLEPIDDAKLVRRAYHVISRDFHPDSYYGKELGPFRPILDDLFRRARASYEFLLDETHRKTLVDVHEAAVRDEFERQQQLELQARAAAQAAKDRARELEEEQERERRTQAALAREQRDRERQERARERAHAQRRKQAKAHAEQAVRERDSGRHGAAATLFRLAHEQDSSNPEYEREWREALATARRQRAEANYNLGRQAHAVARYPEAARHFAEAAEADPSLRNLTEAASSAIEFDPAQARSFAMAALETLQQAQARELRLDDQTVGHVHQVCAKAFLAAGQLATAREQAERAHQLLGTKQTRALLNSIKLP